MLAFLSAYHHNYPIPIWVMEKLNEAFGAYEYGDHPYSLDDLLGCTRGKGKAPARKDYETGDRDVKLMTGVDILVRQGLTVYLVNPLSLLGYAIFVLTF
jgi:hypothetical protein